MMVRGPVMPWAAIIAERRPDIAGIAQCMRFIVPPERVYSRVPLAWLPAIAIAFAPAHIETQHAAASGRRAERADDRRRVEAMLVEMRRGGVADPHHHLDADDDGLERLGAGDMPLLADSADGRHDHGAECVFAASWVSSYSPP